jgi:hypothetical protein
MNNKQTQNDDVDLFDFLLNIWNGKLVIIVFTLVSISVGFLHILTKEPIYESKLFYSVQTFPPFYNTGTEDNTVKSILSIKQKYQRTFYSKKVFNSWRKINKDTTMAYEDFAPTQIIDGFIFSKDEDGRLATLKNTKDTDSFILAKTNNLSLLSELYKYATYVNAELRNSYVERAKGELENFNKKSRQIENEVNSLNEQIKKIKEKPYSKATISERMYMNSSERIHQLQDKVGGKDRAAAMQVYISSVEDGSNLLNIYPPTLPEKISLKSSILILIYGILGIMLGIFFLMIKKSIHSRKN